MTTKHTMEFTGHTSLVLPIGSTQINENPLIAESRELLKSIENFGNWASEKSIATENLDNTETTSLEHKLFDARANTKILTSHVSMHIAPEIREKLFKQIDMLHDIDEWEADNTPVKPRSFNTFLTALLQINPEIGPGLGLSDDGNIIAAWSSNGNRLIIECLPNGYVNWIISLLVDGEQERFSGYTKVTGFLNSIKPHNPNRWFNKKD